MSSSTTSAVSTKVPSTAKRPVSEFLQSKRKKTWRKLMWEAVSKYDVEAVREVLKSDKVKKELRKDQVCRCSPTRCRLHDPLYTFS
jgi:stalled ribosome rescue protein Dom34